MADYPPTHPGKILREDFLDRLQLSEQALALAIGVPKLRVRQIVIGRRPVTPDMALRLARYFGTGAEFWISLQVSYDMEMAREQLGAEIKARVQPMAATATDRWW